jgi:hypothetical protein
MSEQKLNTVEVKQSLHNDPIVSSLFRSDEWKSSSFDSWFSYTANELRRIGADILAKEAIVEYNPVGHGPPYVQIDHHWVQVHKASFGFFVTGGQDCMSCFSTHIVCHFS